MKEVEYGEHHKQGLSRHHSACCCAASLDELSLPNAGTQGCNLGCSWFPGSGSMIPVDAHQTTLFVVFCRGGDQGQRGLQAKRERFEETLGFKRMKCQPRKKANCSDLTPSPSSVSQNQSPASKPCLGNCREQMEAQGWLDPCPLILSTD
jgi:hypothetical protein